MAGRVSVALARRQGAALSCDELTTHRVPRPRVSHLFEATGGDSRVVTVPTRALGLDDFAEGPGWITNPRATRRLMNYWAHGKGAAKIAWGTDGSMRRCIKRLRKYFPQNPGGLCANLHHRATGEWPRGGVIPS